MTRRLIVALLLTGLVLPACAQRGGGGHAGGMSAAPAFRGGAPPARPAAASGPRFLSAPPTLSGMGIAARPFGYGVARSTVNGRGRTGYGPERRIVRGPLVYGYPGFGYSGFGYPGLGYDTLGYGYPGYALGDFLDGPDTYNPNAGPLPEDNAPAYAGPVPAARVPNESEVAAAQAPYPPYEPAPAAPAPITAAARPEPPEEDPVTIIYKDGRPSEQIRNYALTQTTLYVTGRRLREIPLDQIDLAATEKVNKAEGVPFQLPQKQK